MHGTTKCACVSLPYDKTPEPLGPVITKTGFIVTPLATLITCHPGGKKKLQWTKHVASSKQTMQTANSDATDVVLQILSSRTDTRTATVQNER